MKSNIIVSLADAKYFDLIDELVDSIRSFDTGKDIAIGILDAGLTEAQRKILEGKVDQVKQAKWDIEVPSRKVRGRDWLKGLIARAFLPDYFPGHEKYMWIDSDAWVNTWEAVDLYLRGCENGKLAISTYADRANRSVMNLKWVFGGLAKIKSQNYKHAKSCGFPESLAREIALQPHLNMGVFALEHDAPHWEMWKTNMKKALAKGTIFGSDQIAMNITIYHNKYAVEILPTYCNWTLIEDIRYDSKTHRFVEPYLPNHEIGIIHLAGKNNDQIRLDKSFLPKVKTLEGEEIEISLRYQAKKA